MKSFLDRFRRKGEPEPPRKAETTDEIAKEAIESGYAPTLKRRSPGKAEVAPEAVEPGKTVPSAPPETREAAPAPAPSRRDEIVTFELADFLPRIPEQLLGKGPFDPKLPLTFELGELSARIARGQTTLSLAEIYRRVPHLFRGEIRESDNIEIRFPWQKLLELVKAADASKPGSGLSEAAAEALAQKLRSRKRNIGAGPAGADKTVAPRFPAGHRQPSWFSRSAPGTAPAGPGKPEPGPARPPAAPKKPAPAPAPALELVKPKAASSGPAVPGEPPAGSISFAPTSTDSAPERPEAKAEGLPAASGESGSAERQIETLQNERQIFAAQRDQALGELSRLLQEVDEHQNEVKLQKALVEKNQRLAAEAAAERDAARQELAAKAAVLDERAEELRALEGKVAQLQASAGEKDALEDRLKQERSTADQHSRELESLRVEIGRLKESAASELAAIRDERDALLQQKAHLSQQIAQFQKSATISSDTIATEGERSRREYQRQIEELQRRIVALESSQKESAHELGREREARIKAERAASAADRSRGEATALVESIRAEMRREAEAVNRKRDAELARLQKESHEKLEAITDAQRKAASERDELAAEIAALRKTAQEGGAAAAGAVDSGWESRTVASLEADIENYRSRIKTLLKERETLAKEKEELARSSGDGGAAAELKAANEKLAGDLAAAREDRTRLAAQLQEISERLARAESGSSIALAAHQERAQAERSQAEARLGALRTQHETLVREHAATVAKMDELKAQVAAGAGEKASAAEAEQLRAELSQLQEALAEARVEAKKVAEQRDAAQTEVQRLGREIETVGKTVTEESEAALREVREHLAAERETAAQLAADRDAARAEAAKLGTVLEKAEAAAAMAAEEREAALEALRAEFETERKKAQGTPKQRALVAELERTRKDYEERLAALQRDLDSVRAVELTSGTELAGVRSELAALKTARGAAEEKAASLSRERDELRERIEGAETKLRETAKQLSAKEEELAKTLREHERVRAQLNAEKESTVAAALADKTQSISAAAKERDELAAALTEERDVARRESAAVAQRLAAMALESDEKLGALQAQLEARTQEKDTLWTELEAARQTFNSQSAVFAREVKALAKQRDEALAALDNARANLQEKAAALARERVALEGAVEDVKQRTDRELARLRRERDVLVRQRDDLRTRITRMVEEQNKLLEELGTQPARSRHHPSDVSPEPPPGREANVIDIHEADVVKDPGSEDPSTSGVRPPRVRPVPIPPPNVRIL